jgi:hypothetical protein
MGNHLKFVICDLPFEIALPVCRERIRPAKNLENLSLCFGVARDSAGGSRRYASQGAGYSS